MPLEQKLKDAINNAWVDGVPCLVATIGPDGPTISVKGSLIVFDDQHLAYWERSKRTALENLAHDDRVCVMYANLPGLQAGKPGFLRFFGKAIIHDSGPIKDEIFSKLTKREQEHVGADTGIGVLIKIDRAADLRGNPIL